MRFQLCKQVNLGEGWAGHGKGHHGLRGRLLRVELELVLVHAVRNAALVGTKLLVRETLVSKATRLVTTKAVLSIAVSPVKAVIAAVTVEVASPVRAPVLGFVAKGLFWSTVITAIVAAVVLAVTVVVPSAARVAISAVISIPATSTSP